MHFNTIITVMNQEPRERYYPKEGVDYIVDFYAVAGIPRDIEQDEIKKIINEKIKEYHPDGFEGKAEEFQRKAQVMTIELNRAKAVLCDPEKRAAYDEILDSWDGYLSEDGNPVTSREIMEKYVRAQMTAEEIETYLESELNFMNQLSGYDADRLDELRDTLQTLKQNGANEEEIKKVTEKLATALWQEDEMIASREDLLGEFMGLNPLTRERHLPGPDYVQLTQETLAQVVEQETEQRVQRAELEMGSVATRLALLEHNDDVDTQTALEQVKVEEVDRDEIKKVLQQFADRTLELSEKRKELAAEIVATAPLIYPESERQKEVRSKLVVIIKYTQNEIMSRTLGDSGDTHHILAFSLSDMSAESFKLGEDTKAELIGGSYENTLDEGFGIVIFENIYKLEPKYLLESIVDRYLAGR